MRFFLFCTCIFILLDFKSVQAQENSDGAEVYTVSGIGFGFPAGNTADVLSPKISTKIGLDISPAGKAFFIYPSVHLLVFNYDQQEADPRYSYSIQNGRSSTSTFTLAAGKRKRFDHLAVYGFIGPGISLIKEPRTELQDGLQVLIKTHADWTMALTAGTGVEYRLGQFAFFAEGSWLYHFQKIQDRSNQLFPVYGGIKSNISSVFR